jgi:hypothetical protein
MWRSDDVAGYAENFLLGKHLGHVGVIPILACRGRETWRSNFLVPLLLRLRGLVSLPRFQPRRSSKSLRIISIRVGYLRCRLLDKHMLGEGYSIYSTVYPGTATPMHQATCGDGRLIVSCPSLPPHARSGMAYHPLPISNGLIIETEG